MSRIAIIGCGPSGLLAAHGVAGMGHEPVIYSVKQKSHMPGAMFVHEYIPGVTEVEPDGEVTFRQEGTKEGYAEKVYGRADAPVSWDTFPRGAYPAWSMGGVYDRLWDMYGGTIVDRAMDPTALAELQKRYPLVISSMPAKALCHSPYHYFNGQRVWISVEAWRECGENEIIYNGEPGVPWYRTSHIFGHGATETAIEHTLTGAFAGVKPLGTDCDCYPAIKRVGRFGQWRKGVLVHHAFRQAQEEVAWLLGRPA